MMQITPFRVFSSSTKPATRWRSPLYEAHCDGSDVNAASDKNSSPNGAEFSRALQHCPVWRSTDLASCQNLHSRFHEHKLGGRPRSGLPACAEWVHAPEGQAGMEGLPGMPFWLAVTTLATTLRSFHLTLSWPCPSVINTLP